MFEFEGVKIQLVEIPSTFTSQVLSIARTSDLIIFLIGEALDKKEQVKELKKLREKEGFKKYIFVESGISEKELFEKIWNMLGLIRVYTKEPGKPPSKPIVMKAGSTVEDVAKKLHKDFLRYFNYAKISGPSAEFDGQRVGMEHVLKDRDIIEIHLK